MRKITFEEYQKEYSNLFVKINEEFNSNSIFWFAHSGTLLGAKRNGKLIPWDDDIDMGMTAKEFYSKYSQIEKVCKKFNLKIADKSKYIGLHCSKFISNEKIIVIYNNTEYITSMFIDVMISIPVKRKSFLRSYFWFVTNRVTFIFNDFWKPLPSYKFKKGNLIKISKLEHISTWIGRLFVLPLYFLHFIEKTTLKKASKKDYDLYSFHYGWSNLNQYYKKNDFKHSTINNTKIFVNKNWESDLVKRYGKNWRNLPPIEKRKPHHFTLTPYNNGKNNYKIFPFVTK